MSSSPSGENIEDERGAIQYFDAQSLFDVSLLGWGQLVVEDRDCVPGFLAKLDQLVELAFSEVDRGVEMASLLNDGADNFGAGGRRKLAKLFDGIGDGPAGIRRIGVDRGKNGLLRDLPGTVKFRLADGFPSMSPLRKQRRLGLPGRKTVHGFFDSLRRSGD